MSLRRCRASAVLACRTHGDKPALLARRFACRRAQSRAAHRSTQARAQSRAAHRSTQARAQSRAAPSDKGAAVKALYDAIFRDIRDNIENGTYPYQSFLPSESQLVQAYGCSHNTLRRALALLRDQGYVQPIHGKGVRVIYQPVERASFTVGGIESFAETSARNHFAYTTEVKAFENVTADERVAAATGYAAGEKLVYVERVRRLNGVAAILDRSYFLAQQVPGLTAEIAGRSIYNYLEQELGCIVAMGKRVITVERATQHDEKLLDLEGRDYVAVMTTQAFNAQGIMFECTQSRHRPDMFCFRDTAVRSTV